MTNASDVPGPWAKTYAENCKIDMLEAYYADWSLNYDEDSIDRQVRIHRTESGRRGVELACVQEQGFPTDIRIADIGAGNGLVGQELLALGDSRILALDYTPKCWRLQRQRVVTKSYIVSKCWIPWASYTKIPI